MEKALQADAFWELTQFGDFLQGQDVVIDGGGALAELEQLCSGVVRV